MTHDELEALKALAKAATPGPWHSDPNCDPDIVQATDDVCIADCSHGRVADARYIAALAPDVVIGLLDDAETLAGELAQTVNERDALAVDAARWRSLMACERIRVVGGANLGTPDALLGMDFHRKHPARDDADSRAMFLAFVDMESK